MNALEKAEKRKQKLSAVGQVQKAYKAELAFEMAKHEHTQSRWDVTVDLLTAYKALLAEESAKVARLRRQLRMRWPGVQSGCAVGEAPRGSGLVSEHVCECFGHVLTLCFRIPITKWCDINVESHLSFF